MKKLIRKSFTILSATLLSVGILSIPAVKNSINLVPSTITVHAENNFSGTYGGKFSLKYNDTTWLYFSVIDSEKKTASISGCTTSVENQEIKIPDTARFHGIDYTVTSIADSTFENQKNIISISGGKNLTSIGNRAFYNCTNLTQIYLSNDGSGCAHLDSIGDYAFYKCSKLNTCSSLSDTKRIGSYAFYSCQKLTYICLDGTEFIGDHAFHSCFAVSSIELQNTALTSISDHCFNYCIKTTYIKLPNTLTSIGSYAFANCAYYDKIYLPENLKTISNKAFYHDGKLETVMLPLGITSLGDYAFSDCDAMKYFVCKNPNTTIGTKCFGFTDSTKKDNFTIWGKGGNIQTYATNNGFTYHDTSEAPALAKQGYKDYMWKVGNTASSFADSNGNYLIIDQHKPYDMSKAANKEWEGSCYGMAAVSSLIKNGELTTQRFSQNAFTKLSNIYPENLTNYMKSFINTCWSAQPKHSSADYQLGYGFFTNKEMLTYIEYITYGADVCVLSYRGNAAVVDAPGHAIVCFGLEYKEDASDKTASYWTNNGLYPDIRILVYDGNYSGYDTNRCFYVNTQNGGWRQGLTGLCHYTNKTSALLTSYGATEDRPYSGYFTLTHSTDRMLNINVNDL